MTGVTQLFEASASYQVMVLAAALDSGAFPPADRRILLTSVNSAVPEVAPRIEDDPAMAPLLARFDTVASYNDLIAPLHPKGFRPRADETPLFLRSFRRDLGIPDDHVVELALESIHVPPARTLLNVFGESPVAVYAEGLMSYGPTRDPLGARLWARIDRVLHLDLVAGLTPVLLSEHGVPAEVVDAAAFRAVVAELGGAVPAAARIEPYALVLGQYLAPLGLLSAERETALYGDLVEAAAHAGFAEVRFKPHPSAPATHGAALRQRANALGVRLVIEDDPIPAEALYERDPPGLVLGCFSTGLITAARYWGIPVACAGTREVLSALPRFEDSNRIPLVIVDLLVPHVVHGPEGAHIEPVEPPGAAELDRVVRTVSYAMQWRAHARNRDGAAAHLADRGDRVHDYLPRERLRELMLPGGVPLTVSGRAFERMTELAGGVEARRTLVLKGFRYLRNPPRRRAAKA